MLKDVFKIDEKLIYHLPFLLDKIEEDTIKKWLPFKKREHFVFIGNFFHAPNVDAVLQLKKLWKTIRKQLPKAQLHIYGAYATQQIQQLHKTQEGFVVKGFAKNALEVVLNARVVLAPLRFGAGIKGKLTEAMQCGTPSITTTIGAEGMHDNLEWNGFITKTEEEFITKTVALYTNETIWLNAQQNGTTIINNLYNKEALSTPFIQKTEDLQKGLTAHRTQNFIGSLLQHQTLQATKYMSKWIEVKNKNL